MRAKKPSTNLAAWLRSLLRAGERDALRSLTAPARKLPPIDEVVARVGREPV
jgi:hypothetical protein